MFMQVRKLIQKEQCNVVREIIQLYNNLNNMNDDWHSYEFGHTCESNHQYSFYNKTFDKVN